MEKWKLWRYKFNSYFLSKIYMKKEAGGSNLSTEKDEPSRRDALRFMGGALAAMAVDGFAPDAQAKKRQKPHHPSRERMSDWEAEPSSSLEKCTREITAWLENYGIVDTSSALSLQPGQITTLRREFSQKFKPALEQILSGITRSVKSAVGEVDKVDRLKQSVGYKDPSDQLKKPEKIKLLKKDRSLRKLYDVLALARCHGVLYKVLNDLEVFDFATDIFRSPRFDDFHFSFYVEDCLPTTARPEEIEPLLGIQFNRVSGSGREPGEKLLKLAWWVQTDKQALFLAVLNNHRVRELLSKEPHVNWANACGIIRSAIERKEFFHNEDVGSSDFSTAVYHILSQRQDINQKKIYGPGMRVLRLFGAETYEGKNRFDSSPARKLDRMVGCSAQYFEQSDVNPQVVDNFLEAIASSSGLLRVSIWAHGGSSYGYEWSAERSPDLMDSKRLATALLTRYYKLVVSEIFSQAGAGRYIQLDRVLDDMEKNVIVITSSCNGENNTFVNLERALKEVEKAPETELLLWGIIQEHVREKKRNGRTVPRSLIVKDGDYPILELDSFGLQITWDDLAERTRNFFKRRSQRIFPHVIAQSGPNTVSYSSFEEYALEFQKLFIRTGSVSYEDLFEIIEPYFYPRYGAMNVSGSSVQDWRTLRPIGLNEKASSTEQAA